MCGFAVVFGINGAPAERDAVRRMAAALHHRGPDDDGFFADSTVAMGFRRLSILDLSATGHQPMSTEDEHLTIVFNGEIYNYVEVRDELRALGHVFRSTGDTEVLLHAYQQWGADCLQRLRGMWAFVVYDRRSRSLFAARDRFGIKPLYLWRDSARVILCSEIKALLASGCYAPSPDWSVATGFLLAGKLEDSEDTFFSGVTKVGAGETIEIQADGATRTRKYWTLPDRASTGRPNAPAEFAALFSESVRLHTRSDVPVGVHLSGGLDSTSILCAMARECKSRGGDASSPRLTAISYLSPEFDETRYIEDTIAHTGAELIALHAKPVRLWESLLATLDCQDEPIHSMTPVVGFELMKMTAEQGIKVVLNGQGADEVLAGYSSYFPAYWVSLVQQGRLTRAIREIREHERLSGVDSGMTLARLLRASIRSWAGNLPGVRALARRLRGTRTIDHPWYVPELSARLPEQLGWESRADLDSRLRHSTTRYPLPLYLRIEDRNSMAHSVESRLPFLDHVLAGSAFSVPLDWCMRGPWNKHLLREAMRGSIPESVRTRREKFGFPTPMRRWLSTPEMLDCVRDTLDTSAARGRGIYRLERVRRDIERHRNGEADLSSEIFSLVQFELWSQRSASMKPDSTTRGIKTGWRLNLA